MAIDNIDVFANGASAVVTEPSPTEKGIGWVGGEQVIGAHHNWWEKSITEKLNEIVSEGVSDPVYPGTAPKSVISTRLWDITSESWGLTDDTVNTIAGGATKSYQDLEAFYDGDNPRIMALHAASNANTIDVFDPRNAGSPSVDTSGTLLGLDITGAQTWEAVDFCTDGTYAYVLFVDTQPALDLYCVQAYRISDWATGVAIGWPAYGTSLTGSGTGATSTRRGKIIVANATKLAIACTWNQTVNDDSIQTLNMADGGSLAGGYGDCASAGWDTESAIVSDGTYVYWAYYNSGTPAAYLCSAQITNLTVGIGGAFPLNSTDPSYAAGICPAAGILFSIWSTPSSGKIIRAGNTVDPEIDSMQPGTDATANNDRLVPLTIYDAVFDGRDIWIYGAVDVDGAGTNLFAAVWRVSTDKFVLDDNYGSAPTARYLTFADSSDMHIISPREIKGSVTSIGHGAIVFDGRDIWVTPESRPSVTLSGNIYRVPRAVNR